MKTNNHTIKNNELLKKETAKENKPLNSETLSVKPIIVKSKTVQSKTVQSKTVFWPYIEGIETKEAYANNLAARLEEFGADKDSFKISQFFIENKISKKLFYTLLRKYPDLKKAHTRAMIQIGNRREIGALRGLLKEGTMRHVQHVYDKDWDTANKYHAELQAKAQQSQIPETKVVIIDKLSTKDKDENR